MYFYMHTYCHCVLEELLPDKLCGVCPNEFNIHLHSKFTQSGYEKIAIIQLGKGNLIAQFIW